MVGTSKRRTKSLHAVLVGLAVSKGCEVHLLVLARIISFSFGLAAILLQGTLYDLPHLDIGEHGC